ncbi:MAG: DNA polymerase I [Planctomycetaceae bacterium]|jgi:DNA polymerase-1|nr:DNA polymerase I [Planctomycetaceae bacterium]
MLNNKTVYVLDAHGILYQLFHALPPMNSPQGEPVAAVYGFARDLFSLLEKHRPDYLFCAFDMPAPTFRAEIYKEYKANRSAMPEDLRPQIGFAREVLDAMGVLPLGVSGFEADDILATIARMTAEQNGNCVLVTSDKDCRQLINELVSLFNLRKQSFYRTKELLDDWGIKPEQVVDFQSLVGDATDNIPGVPLIGQKIASELLNKFGTLENIFEHVSEIAGKKRQENIVNNKELALMSRQLVRLRHDVPIEIDWTVNKYKGIDNEKLRELFRRFGFKSLLTKIIDTDHTQSDAINSNGVKSVKSETTQSGNIESVTPSGLLTSDNATLFSGKQNKLSENLSKNLSNNLPENLLPQLQNPTYHLVDTLEKFEEFFKQLKAQPIFSFDTETAPMESRFEATSPRYTVIVGMSFAWNNGEAWYLPFRGPLGAATLNLNDTLERLRPVLENPAIGKIGQNLKYDIVVLRNAGVRLVGLVFDTIIADYLLRNEMNHNIDDMAEYYLKHKTIKIEELIGSGKKQRQMNEVQTDIVADYAGEDALVVWFLYPLLKRRIDAESTMAKLFYDIEIPLVEVLAEMEFAGITVDTEMLKKLSNRFTQRQQKLETEIFELAGHEFNVASPKQLATVLFDELGLKSVRKTKTGQSTDIEVLEELSLVHPLPAKVAEHRQLAKLKGTYVDALPELIHPVTGRIHSSFNQVVTSTGRLSSSHPNLQNIPVRTAEGREIRSTFKPGQGFDLLLSCDYSQIELRVLAHFSGDEKLCEAFRNNEDIHTRVAGEVFGVDIADVDSDMRRIAKTVNFGVIYGQSAFGLAKQLGIDQKEAQKFIDGYFDKYSSIRMYLDSILDECLANGYVTTFFGHRRYFRDGMIRSFRKSGLNRSEREAVNTVIQGTAADLMKQAMIRLCGQLPKDLQTNLLLQIHDELVLEVTKKDAEKLKQIVIETMTLNQPLQVPLVVDAELGECWK